jgi:ribose 5-phosphate isomerase A
MTTATMEPPVLVIMGVSGSGKTTIALDLASRLDWPFQEGDALHSAANVAKMHAGIPLTDDDRRPWLEAVAAWIDNQRAQRLPGLITCSALKRKYRAIIVGQRAAVRLVYLRGSFELISQRLAQRRGHFMPAELLKSQFDALEEPGPEENPVIVDIGPAPDQITNEIIRRLNLQPV